MTFGVDIWHDWYVNVIDESSRSLEKMSISVDSETELDKNSSGDVLELNKYWKLN